MQAFILGPGSGTLAPVTEEQAQKLAPAYPAAIIFFAELISVEV